MTARFFPVFLLAFLVSANGIAQTYTYVNNAGLGWSNPNNWNPVGVPPANLTSGQITINVSCNLLSAQTIGAGASMVINPGVSFFQLGTLTLEGELTNQGNFSQLSNLTVAASGSLNIPSGSGAFNKVLGTLDIFGVLNNSAQFGNIGGNLNVQQGGVLNNDSLFLNSSTLNNYGQIVNNRTFQFSGGTFNNGNSSGDLFYNNGTFSFITGSFSNNHIDCFDNSGGVFEGSGTITGDFKNAAGGTVSPNLSNGVFTITGNFINEGTLEMDVINTPQNDQIAVQGTATLNGTLNVTVQDALSSNRSFTLIDANAFTGTFSGGPTLPNPTYWTIDDAAPDYVLTYNGPPLPIRLLDFTGSQQGMAIMLRWATASEADNAFVEVQRSRDGVHFEALGTVPGAGPSDTPRHYQFSDEGPFPGINYYRLRQVDFSGAETFFSVLVVVFSGSPGALQINPNVVSEVLNIQLPSPLPGPGELLVIDLLGRTVCKNSVNFGGQTVHLEVGSLPQGPYWLALRSGGSISVSRFVVQR